MSRLDGPRISKATAQTERTRATSVEMRTGSVQVRPCTIVTITQARSLVHGGGYSRLLINDIDYILRLLVPGGLNRKALTYTKDELHRPAMAMLVFVYATLQATGSARGA